MKKLILLLTLAFSSFSYADFEDIKKRYEDLSNKAISFQGSGELKLDEDNGEMALSGDLASKIWQRAVDELGEPHEISRKSEITGEEYTEQKINYRGWKCLKFNFKTIRDKTVHFVFNRFMNVEGKIVCGKDIFNH